MTVRVEGKTILESVSFSLRKGQSHILLGPNGSGKTTLLSAIMGLPSYGIASGKLSRDQAISLIIRGFMDVGILGLPDALNAEIKRIVETSTENT